MKTKSPLSKPALNLMNIFKYMMEEGYFPNYEYTHISFDLDGTIATVECEDGFASVRIFFSIDKDKYDMFIEASNLTMMKTYAVKPTVMDDRENLIFSIEFLCDGIRDFRRYFPRSLDCLRDALISHKAEMKRLIEKRNADTKKVPDTEDLISGTIRKILS
jgi:hypothetical protein